jgi:hypothetical protein
MQIFSPLFARGRGTIKFLEGLINGDPVAWVIFGIVCAGLAIYVCYHVFKSKAEVPAGIVDDTPPTTAGPEKVCPRCSARVRPMADGKCPACWEHKF